MNFFDIEMNQELLAVLCPTKKAAKKLAKQFKKETGKKHTVKKFAGAWDVQEKPF